MEVKFSYSAGISSRSCGFDKITPMGCGSDALLLALEQLREKGGAAYGCF
jgi:hypothetical protein